MNDASYFVDEHNKLAEKCNHQQAEIERLKAEVHMLHNSTSSRVLSVEIERDEAREASERTFNRWKLAISMVPDVDEDKAEIEFAKWVEQYPWLEEEK